MLAGADALVEALLTELASGIGMDGGKKRAKNSLEAAGKILGYAGLLRHLKYLKYVPGVSLVGISAETVGNALHNGSKLATKAGEAVDSAKKVVEEAENLVSIKVGLGERKKEVIKALAKLDRPIVVIVDDLDRLTPEEIKAVFRTIKAVADFPRVAYVLAYDRNVISESLGGGPISGGNAYIEKIVQVAYPISPAFPWQLQSHISREIASLLSRINRELQARGPGSAKGCPSSAWFVLICVIRTLSHMNQCPSTSIFFLTDGAWHRLRASIRQHATAEAMSQWG